MDLNTRVIKEPRGFIRIIQFIFAILAFSTTAGFDTRTTLEISCPAGPGATVTTVNHKINYKVEYPFNFEDVPFTYPVNCSDKDGKQKTEKFPMQFSSSAQFFVTVGVLCLLYSLGSCLFYVFMTRYYETNPLLPMIDLVATAILSIFWLAGAIAWAVGVSDVQHYTSPDHLKTFIPYCTKLPKGEVECTNGYSGNWASLNVSLIVGFGNVFVWAASCWFVFKETTLHRKQMQPGGPEGFDSFGDPTRQIPQQNQFQQQQLSSGY